MDQIKRMQELAGIITENDKSKKNRFLGIFKPSKDVFQRIIKNVDSSKIDNLIKYTESNGDKIERFGKNIWGATTESSQNNEAVWQYLEGDLYFENPNFPSLYDTYIRRGGINEVKRMLELAGIKVTSKYTTSLNEMNPSLISSMNMILQTTKSKDAEKADMEKAMKAVSDWWSSLPQGEIEGYEEGEPLSSTAKKYYDLMKQLKDEYGVSFNTHTGIWKK